MATFHAYAGWSPSYEFGKRMLQRFARRLHGRIAVSAAARHFIERYFPGDYKVIPNGVDLRALPERRSRSRAGATARSTSCSSAGSRAARALMYLLKAYRQLRTRGHRLPAAGDRRGAAGARGPPLHRHARAWPASSCWAASATTDKARYFATADIYVSPATGQESFGIVLLEAMAAGTPIVCSDIHGYKGVVRRGEQALLVPPKDVEALAEALGTLLDDPQLRARMGASGRERATSSAGRTSPPRWRTTTASSSAAWPPRAQLPSDFHRSVLEEIGPAPTRERQSV